MEYFENSEYLLTLLSQYGSIVLFLLLILGIVALPIPEETLMVLSGILMSNGHLNIPFTVLAAITGSMCGITVSYFLGRTAGAYLLNKYQGWLGITEKHISYVQRYGKWALFIGYFIPGVRHFSGLSFGMTSSNYKQFALFAYSGAIVWASLFLSIGYFFGNYPLALFEHLEISFHHVILAAGVLAGLYLAFFLYKKKRVAATIE